ncbi:MAG: hypothetical protein WDM71_09375 [Ferruginibacter sp.]
MRFWELFQLIILLQKNNYFQEGVEFYQDNVEKEAHTQSPILSRQTTFDPTVYLLDGKDTLLNLYSTFKPRLYDIRNNFGSYLQYILKTNFLVKTDFTFGVRYDYNS